MNEPLNSSFPATEVAALPAFVKLGTINHIRLTVTDIARADRFYTPLLEFLGYRPHQKSETRVAWTAREPDGSKRLFIVSVANPELIDHKHNRYAPGLHHIGFNAINRAQVDEFYQLLRKTGAEILDAPAEYRYQPGYYAVYFADPDGIKLEVVHIPT